jgi:hypothetical protein
MDIDEFVQHLNSNRESVIKGMRRFELTMNESNMIKQIKDHGYKYDKQKREWGMDIVHTTSHGFTLGEKKANNVVSIGFDSVPEEQQEDLIHTASHDVNSHKFTQDETSSHDFTWDEIEAIRTMLNDWKKDADPVGKTDLVNRVKAIPKDEKARKTIVISKVVGERLDNFCEENRVQKSSVLELAIEDFISKYR